MMIYLDVVTDVCFCDRRDCLGARDPYCGWDRKQKSCTTIENSSNMSQWSQDIIKCPVRHSFRQYHQNHKSLYYLRRFFNTEVRLNRE